MNKIVFKKFDFKQIGLWQYIYLGIASIGLIMLIVMSQGAGISGDEFYHYDHAANVYNYYKTFGEDSTAAVITQNYNLPYYGQIVDNFAYFITKTFSIDDFMGFRHGVNAFMGWLAIIFASLFVKRISSWQAAIITLVLMFISPRFIGHSFNNLKDLPLATATIMSIYFITKFLDQLPKIKISTAIWLTLSIAFAIAVRVGGLIVIGYFALFALVYYIYKYKTLKKEFTRVLIWSLGISLTAYILAVLSWPFALQAPIDNPKETLGNMTKFAITLRQIFEGTTQWSDYLPWYYTPKFIFMTIPTIVIVGFVLGIVMMFKYKKLWFYNFILLFTFIFPVFWIVVNGSNVYGGWRHAIFVYPSLAAFSGLGIYQLIKSINKKYIRYVLILAFSLISINPVAHSIRNHPYEYVYFNELSGGMKKAYGNYELDYYFHSLREASEWIIENAEKDGKKKGEKIKIGCWHIPPVQYYFRKDTADFDFAFLRYYERGNYDWDYAIVCNTGIAPEQLKNNTFPPKNTVYEVKVDGKPICVVLKREDKSDFIGSELKNKDSILLAIPYLQKAIKLDNANESAINNLAEIYLRTNRADSVVVLMDELLKINPNSESANYFKAYGLFLLGQNQESLNLCDKVIKINPKFQSAYSLGANIKLNMQDLYGAEAYLNGLIAIDRLDNQSMQQLLMIYQASGLDERNAYIKFYSIMAEHYKKKGEKKLFEEYDNAVRNLIQRR